MKEKELLENFILYFPFMKNKIVDWYVDSFQVLIVKLDNGESYSYDDLDHTIRKLPNNPDLMSEQDCRYEFGIRLRRMMLYRGVTQKELCERTGISLCAISQYMNYKITPNFYNVDKIAKALECSTDDFRYL